MLALTFDRSLPRFAAVRAAGGQASVAAGPLSLLSFGEVPEPVLPAPDWVRVEPLVAGICGSDLAAVGGHASFYLDALTSYPFVPGHEVVGEVSGSRVVVEPALGCVVRGISPLCAACSAGRPGLCENATEGVIDVGLQTGYCASTGGGWGETLVAHPSQLWEVPSGLSDEAASLIEPFACCIHAAVRGAASPSDLVVVLGAGTIGLLTIAAVRRFTPPRRLIAVAKHGVQRDLALQLGADQVIGPDEVFQRVRFASGARRLEAGAGVPRSRPVLLGGADVVFECVGRGSSLGDAVRLTRGGGRLVVVGMPAEEKVDWGVIWQRELSVLGAYAYGVEAALEGRRTFELALEAAPSVPLDSLVGPLFGLGDYRDAIAYAMSAGSLGAVKVAFDLRRLRP
jgi:threonine dehydrogenase-like Zn-dependent dehydrogenase